MVRKVALSEKLFTNLTSVRFTLKNKQYEIDLGEELLVGSEDLHSQVERIPAILGYFGSIVALLQRELDDKKTLSKKIEARLDRSARDSGIIGETRIQKLIRRQSKWVDADLEVNKAKYHFEQAKYLYAALKEKSIVLITRSGDIRNTPSDSIRGVKKGEVIRV